MPNEIPKARAQNARPKIERAAMKLFVDAGIEASTTRKIADEAGVSEGALYRHYKGKDELALSLFMQSHQRLSEIMQDAFSGTGDLETLVRRAVTSYCAFADEDWLEYSFHLVSMNRYLPHDVRRADDPVSIVETLLNNLMDAGEIPRGDPAIIGAMALGVVMQAGHNKIYNRLPGTMSQHVDAFTRAIMAIIQQK